MTDPVGNGVLQADFGRQVRLPLGGSARFPDGLEISLQTFSHKHPYVGGPTKATAYLKLRRNGGEEAAEISVHGVEGQPEETFDTLDRRDYQIALRAFDYDRSIDVVVRPAQGPAPGP